MGTRLLWVATQMLYQKVRIEQSDLVELASMILYIATIAWQLGN